MKVYRICREKYAKDLKGTGAELAGGRWNSRGKAILYTSESRALAMVEVAVHLPYAIIPQNYVIVTIEIPEKGEAEELHIQNLPKNWNALPFERSTQIIGDAFISDNKKLLLKAPSVVVKGDFNYLVNPNHKDFENVKIIEVEAFEFDSRIYK